LGSMLLAVFIEEGPFRAITFQPDAYSMTSVIQVLSAGIGPPRLGTGQAIWKMHRIRLMGAVHKLEMGETPSVVLLAMR